MDTVLREGKGVYSQACWLMALTSFANLSYTLNKDNEAQRLLLILSIPLRIKCGLRGAHVIWISNQKIQIDDDSTNILYQDIIFYIFAMKEQSVTTYRDMKFEQY